MNARSLLEAALQLPPTERFELVDELMHSLDRPDPEIDRLWTEDAERRLAARRAGLVQGIPAADVVGDF